MERAEGAGRWKEAKRPGYGTGRRGRDMERAEEAGTWNGPKGPGWENKKASGEAPEKAALNPEAMGRR